MPFKHKRNTHMILKNEDIERYLSSKQKEMVSEILYSIDKARVEDGKNVNSYYVVNLDEPYAQEVFEVIKKGEIQKEKDSNV